MTVVAQGTNWWIESFTVTRAALLDGNTRVSQNTLERPGVFMGGSICLDHNIADTGAMSVGLRNTDNSQLEIGDNVTIIASYVANNTGGSRTIGEIVVVFLRKP